MDTLIAFAIVGFIIWAAFDILRWIICGLVGLAKTIYDDIPKNPLAFDPPAKQTKAEEKAQEHGKLYS